MLKVQNASTVAYEAVDKLIKALNESRANFEKEKALLVKEHKTEIKVLKKDLGKTNKQIIDLTKK